ncbi:MAG: CsgG/HfaB family protein [Gammaproteobacteria bacterium]|nr:CsgG/HfaB family protein [Gammaproteobacteria bacterium]MDH3372449.1 CsgG/HfaB family protein [Gammaproteobacteria bacterium]MDH3407884.1 CsgG/HfaB family protein [Gammaproteobacteria bacterium]MDH3551347.1 CsgG/HfaB family protein [Gammaproteobacteria bacterium]
MNFRKLPVFLSVVLALTGMQYAVADYVAYSVSKKGRSPLPEHVDNIGTKFLLDIEWGEYAGRKARLGVMEVDNDSPSSSYTVSTIMGDIDYSDSATGVPVNGIEAIVIDALSRTGRFRLVERTELGSVLDEQDLAASGRIAKPSGAKTGKVLGAEYLVQLVVTDYETSTSGSDKGVGGLLKNKVPLIGGVKAGSSSGRVGLNIRLIDAETSEITFTKQIEAVIKETNIGFAGAGWGSDVALGGFLSNYSKTPIGQAVIAGVNQAVFELVKQVGAKPAEGSIVKAEPTQIYTNLGQDSVAPGERLQVIKVGEQLIDPETGISLGGSSTVIGEIEVKQVEEKFSIAAPILLTGTPERGDKLVSTKVAAPLEFADKWKKPK